MLFLYIVTCVLLILHEIESAFEKEWEILKMPVRITGFLLLHIPILFIMFYAPYLFDNYPLTGKIIFLVIGLGGLLPFLVHNIFVRRKNAFNKPISHVIMIMSSLAGIVLVIVTILSLVKK